MVWIRCLMRTAFIFLVTMTMLTSESDTNIRTLWLPLTGKEPLERAYSLETDGRRLYAGTRDGLYVSRDNGNTWHSTGLNHGCWAIAITQNSAYAGTTIDGVLRSDDRGETWMSINNGLPVAEKHGYPGVAQILVTSSGTVIAVMHYQGTYTSTDRGETWRDVSAEWKVRLDARELPGWIIGKHIWSMTEFDGYLWASSGRNVYRSTDNGQTWEYTRENGYGEIADWAVLNDRLYAGTRHGLARWNEAQPAWEYFSEGLPVLSIGATASIKSLTVYRGRLFAGLYDHAGAEGGVYMFDDRIDTFVPAGLQGSSVSVLISHQSELYAAVDDKGIYRASIPPVQPYGKAATTWARVKQGVLAK